MGDVLTVENVNKTIKGRQILVDVNLRLESGNVYGFTGRNGSGKSMLFRALSGLIKIDSGRIDLNGKVLHRDFSVLPGLGITIENVGMYPDLTGVMNLEYFANFTKKIGKADIENAILRVGLAPDDRRTYRKYSLGMKQRLAIAQAIMEKPDIIILDEPTNSLDDSGVDDIRKVVLEEKQRGAMVLVASHNKEDISILADELYKVDNGHVKKQMD